MQKVAETTTQTTTTTTAGTITEFGPSRLVVRTTTSEAPVGYTFTKETTYVDEAGAPVSIETVKSGLPVTVHYVNDGGRMMATKVIVRTSKSTTGAGVVERRTTTTATSDPMAGVISDFGGDTFVIRSEGSPEPVRYR